MRPLIPATSLMRTPIARLPGAILTSSPGPLPTGASRAGVIGSPAKTPTRVIRPTAESSEVKAPAGTLAAGHSALVTAARSITAPSGISRVATTTRCVDTRDPSLVACSALKAPSTATRPTKTAKKRIVRKLGRRSAISCSGSKRSLRNRPSLPSERGAAADRDGAEPDDAGERRQELKCVTAHFDRHGGRRSVERHEDLVVADRRTAE